MRSQVTYAQKSRTQKKWFDAKTNKIQKEEKLEEFPLFIDVMVASLISNFGF